jgi:hypothetical protein
MFFRVGRCCPFFVTDSSFFGISFLNFPLDTFFLVTEGAGFAARAFPAWDRFAGMVLQSKRSLIRKLAGM